MGLLAYGRDHSMLHHSFSRNFQIFLGFDDVTMEQFWQEIKFLGEQFKILFKYYALQEANYRQ